jgi:hypothetical protein
MAPKLRMPRGCSKGATLKFNKAIDFALLVA